MSQRLVAVRLAAQSYFRCPHLHIQWAFYKDWTHVPLCDLIPIGRSSLILRTSSAAVHINIELGKYLIAAYPSVSA